MKNYTCKSCAPVLPTKTREQDSLATGNSYTAYTPQQQKGSNFHVTDVSRRRRSISGNLNDATMGGFVGTIIKDLSHNYPDGFYVGNTWYSGYGNDFGLVGRRYTFIAERKKGFGNKLKYFVADPMNRLTGGFIPMIIHTFNDDNYPFHLKIPGEILRIERIGKSKNIRVEVVDERVRNTVQSRLEELAKENPYLNFGLIT